MLGAGGVRGGLGAGGVRDSGMGWGQGELEWGGVGAGELGRVGWIGIMGVRESGMGLGQG